MTQEWMRSVQMVARVFLGIIVVLSSILIVSPRAQMFTGSLFFGRIPALYHLPLAQMWYTMAAHPYFGQEVPPYAFHHLSRTYFIQGDFAQALRYGYQELSLYPNHFTSHYIIGLTYGYMDMPQHAIYAFGQYLVWHPDSWAARNDRAWIQFQIGDIAGAIDTMMPAVTLYPDNPWVANTFCVLLLNQKEYASARASCERAKASARAYTSDTWGEAYPGNDPRLYEEGLARMRGSIESNLALLRELGY